MAVIKIKIGIVDADLLGRKNHRYPNLACEKISAYHKDNGDEVSLLLDYEDIYNYDQVFISKVFTDTPVPDWVGEFAATHKDCVHIGGSGFFFDKAPPLPEDIEHHMPDYNLYNNWIEGHELKSKNQFKMYTDYSIGFLTRGCFRKCPFCINQNYDRVVKHSPLEEFYDPSRKKICLLDDNILAYPQWREELSALINTGKPFVFKQGMDERLLTDEKCELLFKARYDDRYIFAFDNIKDYDIIEEKMKLIRKYTDGVCAKFYVLVGFPTTDITDIENMWRRIALIMKYRFLPYIMRYQSQTDSPWKHSEFKSMYVAVAEWCNQPSLFCKMSFREFCALKQKLRIKTPGKKCAELRALEKIEAEYPQISREYFDMKFNS